MKVTIKMKAVIASNGMYPRGASSQKPISEIANMVKISRAVMMSMGLLGLDFQKRLRSRTDRRVKSAVSARYAKAKV